MGMLHVPIASRVVSLFDARNPKFRRGRHQSRASWESRINQASSLAAQGIVSLLDGQSRASITTNSCNSVPSQHGSFWCQQEGYICGYFPARLITPRISVEGRRVEVPWGVYYGHILTHSWPQIIRMEIYLTAGRQHHPSDVFCEMPSVPPRKSNYV